MRRLFGALLFLVTVSGAAAGDLEVTVRDGAARPLANTVVEIRPLDRDAHTPTPATRAIMDQVDRHFLPHVLPVAPGTAVTFPNSDQIRHSIYSFSPAKRFQVRLYRGTPADPVVFDRVGIVVLGCNIHDSMVGYVYVTDAPWFSRTDDDGRALIPVLPPGTYQVSLWHPKYPADAEKWQRTVTAADEPAELTATLDVTSPSIHERKPGSTDSVSPLQQRFNRFGGD